MKPDQVLRAYENMRHTVAMHKIEESYVQASLQRLLSSEEKDSLVRLRGLAVAALMFETLTQRLEEFCKVVAAEQKDLAENIIPSLMDELEIPSLSLSETQQLAIKTKTTANIPAARLEEGCKWLEENGFGAIIKQVVSTEFGTKEGAKAVKVVEAIKALDLGISPSVKKSVNHMTLGALVREQLEGGAELPFELLGVYRRRSAVVSEKKT